jgi:hypothetical protein
MIGLAARLQKEKIGDVIWKANAIILSTYTLDDTINNINTKKILHALMSATKL